MNKAYRVVFNKAIGVWMAVSEIARGRGKGRAVVQTSASALIAGAAIVLAPSAAAADLVVQDPDTGTINVGRDVGNGPGGSTGTVDISSLLDGNRRLTGVAVGRDINDAVNYGQFAGVNAGIARVLGASINSVTGQVVDPTYTLGADSKGDTTFRNVSGALGNLDDRIKGNAASIANNTTNITNLTNGTAGMVQQAAPGADITVAKDTDGTAVDFAGKDATGNTITRKLTNVANGTQATDAVNLSQLEKATSNNYVAYNAVAETGPAAATGNDALAVGGASLASGAASTAVGAGTAAVGNGSVAVGNNAGALDTGAVAIGQFASANFASSIAIGAGAEIGGKDAVAIGANSRVLDTVENSVALGTGSVADRASTVSVGSAGKERQITNVAAGTSGTDAVNFGQLSATASSVAEALGGGAAVGADGKVTAPTYSLATSTGDATKKDFDNVGSALENLDTRTSDNTTNINNLSQQIGEGSIGLVQKDVATGNLTVDSAGAGTEMSFAGTDSAGNTITRKLTHVTAGTADTDAANYGQVKAVHDDLQAANALAAANAGNVAAALGGSAKVDPATGLITPPTYVLSPDPISGQDIYHNVGDALSNLNNHIVNNAEDIDKLGTQLGELDTRAVKYDTTGNTVTLDNGSGNAIQIKNVADGSDDTDAVNVRQLRAAGVVGDDGQIANVVTYTGDTKTEVKFGNDGTPVLLRNVKAGEADTDAANVGQVKAVQAVANNSVQYDASGTSVTLKGAGTGPVQIKNVADGSEDTDAVNVRQLKAAGVVGEDGSLANVVTYDSADKTSVTFNKGGEATRLQNVANGVAASDAVNFGQLTGVGSNLAGALGGGASYTGGVWTPPSYTVGGETHYNVGDALANLDGRVVKLETGSGGTGGPAGGGEGQANAMFASTGATPTSKETATASGNNATAAGANATATANNSVALGANSVADRANTVSVGSVGNERAITNVADGAITENSKEAVNGGQLYSAQAKIADMQNSVNSLQSQVNQVDTKVNRVGAMSAAMSTMVASAAGLQTDNRMAIGTGVYRGQAALAIGYQRKIGSRATVTIGGSTAGGSEYNVGVGAGFGW